VLVEQVNGIDLQPFERGLGDLLDVLRPTVKTDRRATARIDLPPERAAASACWAAVEVLCSPA